MGIFLIGVDFSIIIKKTVNYFKRLVFFNPNPNPRYTFSFSTDLQLIKPILYNIKNAIFNVFNTV